MGQAGGRPSKDYALPRVFVAAVYDCRIRRPSGAHRDAASAIALKRKRIHCRVVIALAGAEDDVAAKTRGQCAFPFIFVLRDFVWSD